MYIQTKTIILQIIERKIITISQFSFIYFRFFLLIIQKKYLLLLKSYINASRWKKRRKFPCYIESLCLSVLCTRKSYYVNAKRKKKVLNYFIFSLFVFYSGAHLLLCYISNFSILNSNGSKKTRIWKKAKCSILSIFWDIFCSLYEVIY